LNSSSCRWGATSPSGRCAGHLDSHPATIEYAGAVTSVDVTVNRGALGSAPNASNAPGGSTLHKVLTGAAAQRLANAFDALPVATPSVNSCPMDRGFTDDLVFHSAAHTIDAVDEVGGCEGIGVTVDGMAQPGLSGSIDAEVTAELGLPAAYGN
jgi:hypothetical protein